MSSLLTKLIEFSNKPLWKWAREYSTGHSSVFKLYGSFPPKSNFSEPKYVPLDVSWGRFRLASRIRLIGFTIPDEIAKQPHSSGFSMDSNTFYVVFYDENHQFYLS